MPIPILLLHLLSPLPLRTDRTLRRVPYVTYALCYLNLFIYLANIRLSEYQLNQVNHQYGFIINHPSLFTLFSYAFYHADIFHITGNLLVLWIVGTVLEAGIGSLLFALLYTASIVTSVLLYGIIGRAFFPDALGVPLIGASGAISGITGFAALRYFHIRVLTVPIVVMVPIPVQMLLPLWVYAAFTGVRDLLAGLLQIQYQGGGPVANWAHIGGMGIGILAALLLRVFEEGRREVVLEDSAKISAGKAPVGQHSLQELEVMLAQNPDDPELLEAMAGLWLSHGDHEQSLRLYGRAIPNFITRGQLDRAAISYLNILRTSPDTAFEPREQMALASALETQQYPREAVHAFLLIHQHFGEREEAQTALLRAALVYQRRLNDRDGAVRLLRQLIDEHPDSPWRALAQERLRALVK